MPFCDCGSGYKAIKFCPETAEKCPGKAKGQFYFCIINDKNHQHYSPLIALIAPELFEEVNARIRDILSFTSKVSRKCEERKQIIDYFNEVNKSLPISQRNTDIVLP